MSFKRAYQLLLAAVVVLIIYVVWNADYTDYTEVENLIGTGQPGRIGSLEWIPFERATPLKYQFINNDFANTLQISIAPFLDIGERLSGHSRQWFSLSVTATGNEIDPADIENLPVKQIKLFDARNSILKADSAKSLSKLMFCKSLSIRRLDEASSSKYLSQIPGLERLNISTTALDHISDRIKDFSSLQKVVLLGNQETITRAMLMSIASNKRIVSLGIEDATFEPRAASVLNSLEQLMYLTINNCADEKNFDDLDLKCLSQVEALHLEKLHLGAKCVESIAGTNIESLSVWNSDISACIAMVINKMPRLRFLSLRNLVGPCLSLKTLDPNCQIEKFDGDGQNQDFDSFQAIAKLSNIKEMFTCKWKISDSDFIHFEPGRSLKFLDIKDSGVSPDLQIAFYKRYRSIGGQSERLSKP
ncbi:hypothetical protein K2Y11_01555 [bacterium]|nr:hypothetical protein [bacterium]